MGRGMANAKRIPVGRWDAADPAEKLSSPFLHNDVLLQNRFLILKWVVWREMSGGSWNATKPKIKGVSCTVWT